MPPQAKKSREKKCLELLAQARETPTGCLVIPSIRPDRHGYVYIHWQGRRHPCHRFIYETMFGDHPPKFVTDHLCRNPACCNPAHLEPVTNAVNLARGAGYGGVLHKPKTHCRHGHEYAVHGYFDPKINGRRCRICRRASERAAFHAGRRKRKPSGFWPDGTVTEETR